jgi:hypothetical protein
MQMGTIEVDGDVFHRRNEGVYTREDGTTYVGGQEGAKAHVRSTDSSPTATCTATVRATGPTGPSRTSCGSEAT